MTCAQPGCELPKGKGRYCVGHEQRHVRGWPPMDAPLDPGKSNGWVRKTWPILADAAERYAHAVRCGWSPRALRAAEERLKRAAERYRRAYKPRRNAVATRGQPVAAGGDGCPEASEANERRAA